MFNKPNGHSRGEKKFVGFVSTNWEYRYKASCDCGSVFFFKNPIEFHPDGAELICQEVAHDRLLTYECLQCNKLEIDIELMRTHHKVNHQHVNTRRNMDPGSDEVTRPSSNENNASTASVRKGSADEAVVPTIVDQASLVVSTVPEQFGYQQEYDPDMSPANHDLIMPKEPWYEPDETDQSRRYRITCRQCRARTYMGAQSVLSYGDACRHEDTCASVSLKKSYFFDCRACGWRYFDADGLQYHQEKHHSEETALDHSPVRREAELSHSASSTKGLYSSSNTSDGPFTSVRDMRVIRERMDLDEKDGVEGDFLHDALFEGHEITPHPLLGKLPSF